MSVRILLNGEETEVSAGTTMGQLVDRVRPDRTRIAVERNKKIVPRAELDSAVIAPGDEVEIVTLTGGG